MPRKIRVAVGGSEGRMGRIIQGLTTKTSDIEVVYGFDPRSSNLKSFADLLTREPDLRQKLDVYVDFTTPDAVLRNVDAVSQAGIDTVIGTTGWYDHLDDVAQTAVRHHRRILYAPNYAPGVNVLFYATREVARLLGKFGYDVAVREVHHAAKVDAPSGTAIALGNILLQEMQRATLAYERREKRADTEIDVLGVRVGRVAGSHEIWFTPKESYSERLVLQHDAFTPEVFGIGVLTGIRWIADAQAEGKPAGLYSFAKDVLGLET